MLSRDANLAGDDVPLSPVIIDAVKQEQTRYNVHYEDICTLQPTSPLRDYRDIQQAFLRYRSLKADSLISVTEELHSIWLSDNGLGVPLVYNKVNRQYARPHYLGNGAIFITKNHILFDDQDRIGGNIALHVMDKISSIDVHTIDDIRLVEYYMGVI